MKKWLKYRVFVPLQLVVILTVSSASSDLSAFWHPMADSCQIFQSISPPPDQSHVYISQLSFIDAEAQTALVSTMVSDLMSDAIASGIERGVSCNPNLKYNAPGHTIANTEGNINKLIELIFNPNLTPPERVRNIIDQILDPNGVDIVITGNYVDQGDHITFKLMAVVRASEKVIAKTLNFNKEKFICNDPAGTPYKKALCKNSYENIAYAIKEFFEAL